MKYRKLPIEVEAFKLGEEWPDWWADAVTANRVKTYNQDERWRGGPDYALIQTLEGEMRAEKGDWIIQGVKGEIYPCKADVFAITYAVAGSLTRGAEQVANKIAEVFESEYARDEYTWAETAKLVQSAIDEAVGEMRDMLKLWHEKFSDENDSGPRSEGWQSDELMELVEKTKIITAANTPKEEK